MKNTKKEDYVSYKGKMVLREYFRVYVYDAEGKAKLVNTYDEYLKEISSGLWKDSPDMFEKVEDKKKGKN